MCGRGKKSWAASAAAVYAYKLHVFDQGVDHGGTLGLDDVAIISIIGVVISDADVAAAATAPAPLAAADNSSYVAVASARARVREVRLIE